MEVAKFQREMKKGSAEFLILALLEERELHGYGVGKLIEERTNGVVQFHVASLYPLLYRLQNEGLIKGRWREKSGERRRRYYRLTAAGARTLAAHRTSWRQFAEAVNFVVGVVPEPVPEAP